MNPSKTNRMDGVSFLCCLFLSFLLPGLPVAQASWKLQQSVTFQDIVNKAKALADQPYQEPNRGDIPETLKKIGYDQWRDIRYKPVKSLWAKDPFRVQFFHRGFIYQEPVIIHYVDRNGTHTMPFSPDLFDYKKERYGEQLSGDVGFAGFRIHYPLNVPTYADELVSFLGASYFRALGKNLGYGLSARGLAVNTATDVGEEFPYFKDFWLIHPNALSREITLFALLDSQSLTGAYEFAIHPGEETVMRIKSTIFFRKKIKKMGVAPLSSMFYYGKNSGPRNDGDFRLEVHDSDGFLTENKLCEWTWHPLINPQRLVINYFGGGQPLGFGLIQRDTNFDHYQDLEARYEMRPSVWIEPEGEWGPGHVELYQIPSGNEYNDNISTYWVPEREFNTGDTCNYSYNLYWHSAKYRRPPLAMVESTRIMRKGDNVTFLIDFHPDPKQDLLAKTEKDYTAEIQEFNGYKVVGSQIIQNTVTKGLRLLIYLRFDKEGFLQEILPKELPAVELRASIREKEKNTPVTETWSYTYLP